MSVPDPFDFAFGVSAFGVGAFGLTVYTVVAPPQDAPGAALMASIIAAEQAAIAAESASSPTVPAFLALINQLQVQAVDHFMVTGWLNAASILALYQPPAWDQVGQTLAARVAFLQNLVNITPPAVGLPNNVGFLANFQQQLYQAQIQLVEHIMDLPGGTSAMTILTTMTGFQSFPFEYVFTSIGSTDTEAMDEWP